MLFREVESDLFRRKVIPAALLLLAGIHGFGALRALQERSLIPRQLDGAVTAKEVRFEKHPGRDDVSLLSVDGATNGQLRVDAPIFEAIDVGDRLSKTAGADAVAINGSEVLSLRFSSDAVGMKKAVWFGLLLVAAALTIARFRSRR